MTKLASAAVICVGLSALPAHAMNWEGHDDWMADLPAAIELQAATDAAPLPPRSFRPCQAEARPNPYEQIPLASITCRKATPEADTLRQGAQP